VIRRCLLHEWVEALQLAWEHDGDGPVSGEGCERLRMPIGTLDDIPSPHSGLRPVRVPRVVRLGKWLRFREKRNVCWFLTVKRILERGQKV
jgi:hypothetical protein